MSDFKVVKPYIYVLVFFLVPFLLFLLIKTFFFETDSQNLRETKAVNIIKYAIILHGGAGNFVQDQFTPEEISSYKTSMYHAIQIGLNALDKGDSAVVVAVKVVTALEDDSMFNAGKGAVLNINGIAELDASIMEGAYLKAGAVAAVHSIKNPVKAALKVMQNSPHVLLTGSGAEDFARNNNLEIVSNSYFVTKPSLQKLESWKNKKKENQIKGTVGCVVLDSYGNLAAATSTGGMMGKMPGRVGDTPIIGAGTYANNRTCAVSATGHGEYFIRYHVAGSISDLMEYKNLSLHNACKEMIFNKMPVKEGYGGVIAIDSKGNICIEFSTKGMFRAYARKGEEVKIKLFDNNDADI